MNQEQHGPVCCISWQSTFEVQGPLANPVTSTKAETVTPVVYVNQVEGICPQPFVWPFCIGVSTDTDPVARALCQGGPAATAGSS
jgi:hypothetical protein